MDQEAASPEGQTWRAAHCPPTGDAQTLLPWCFCSGCSPGQDGQSQEPHGVTNDRGLARNQPRLGHLSRSSRIKQLPVTSALSPTGCRHQAQELALPVELGLVSDSAHVLCSPTNFSEGSRFTEVLSLLGIREGSASGLQGRDVSPGLVFPMSLHL